MNSKNTYPDFFERLIKKAREIKLTPEEKTRIEAGIKSYIEDNPAACSPCHEYKIDREKLSTFFKKKIVEK